MDKQNIWFIGTTYVVLLMLCYISICPFDSVAGIIPSRLTINNQRQLEIEKIQRFLEQKIVRKKLIDYGVSPVLVGEKINMMSNEDVHKLSLLTYRAPEGGENADYSGLNDILALALIVVVLLIYLMYLGVKNIVTYSNGNILDNNIEHRPN